MRTIVFVHGYMNTGLVWSEWRTYFEERGFICYVPSWPYLDAPIRELQKKPHPALKDVSFADVIEHYQHYIEELEECPILIGHSLGGVIVQKLLETGHGQVAVCINGGPPKGIFAFHKDFILSNLQLTNPFSTKDLVLMDAKWYHRYVTNDLTYEETERFIKDYCVPASRKVVQTIEKIDFKSPHKPLLFIAGECDYSQPPIINQKNATAYTDSNSFVAFKLFQKRTHHIIGQQGWQEVASYIDNWLIELFQDKKYQ